MPARPINREIFITCAVTGAGETLQKHPGVPVTPEQIADAAIKAAKAGAAVVHCHVRDPKTGKGSRDVSLYREVFKRIRASDTDVVINFTAGMGGDVGFGPGESPEKFDKDLTDLVGPMTRLPHIEELRPEICTLDCGSMNFGDGDFIIMNTPDLLRTMAKRFKELGVKPECEVFDTGHLWFVNQLIKEGLLADPPMVQLCMGIPYGAPADIGTAKAMADMLPENAIFSGFAISRDEMPFVAAMPLIGGNVRVGLEDNLYLRRGVLATNAQLVEQAVEILERMGCKIMGPEDVRKKLGLVKHMYNPNPNSAPSIPKPLATPGLIQKPARPILREVFITCAVTGAGETLQKHPGVPVTPEQIADAAIKSAKAGAAIVHCHVRDPKTGKGSRDVALYREVFKRIRASDTDVVINFTAGMGGDVGFGAGESPEKLDKALTDLVGPMARLPHIEELKPEICTLDCGSMNFGDGDFIIMNTPDLLRAMAKRFKELGVKPECEVFDTGHLWFVNQLIKEGLLSNPPMVQLCMGIPYGAPADIGTAKAMVANLPDNAIFSGFAISRDEMPFVAAMPLLGGNVRVGLEDNLYLKRGVIATNEQLVTQAKEILERMGCKVLGPEDVRKKLGLVKHPYVPKVVEPERPLPPAKRARKLEGNIQKVTCIGGGVIGSAWAARYVLNGLDVTVFDLDPECERKTRTTLANAELAFGKLTLAPLRKKGTLTFTTNVQAACKDADFITESLPEREDLKRKVLAEVSKAARPEVVIASSTSGLLPSHLQMEMTHPERLVIAHPFNPVYLLPLVEVCGSPQTAEDAKKKAAALYESIGMYPLMLQKEVPGFVSDRLLEALWREGLHLINDGVATTEQVDHAICYGPGIRWSFMGTFLIYRLAGGEAGMKHFLSQFGPCLKLPWTKLEAPELTDELIERIVKQSDDQAGSTTIRELEVRRDDCLVAVMQALKGSDYASGSVLKNYEEKLYAEASENSVLMGDTEEFLKPLRLHTDRVRPDWIDYNGHMTESRYLQVFGDGTDALLRYVGVNDDYLKQGCSYYTVETHIMNKKEVKVSEPLAVATLVLKIDEKRMHIFHTIEHGKDGTVLATAEQMLLHVNTKEGKTCPVDQAIGKKLMRIADGHNSLERPKDAGRFVGAPRTNGQSS